MENNNKNLKMLTKKETDKMFEENAILVGGMCDGIYVYKIIELFGEIAEKFMNKNMYYGGYMKPGKDYNISNAGMSYLYKTGFYKVVANYNDILALAEIEALVELRECQKKETFSECIKKEQEHGLQEENHGLD